MSYLYIFLISMVPLIELRGAVLYSQYLGLPIIRSYVICAIGNMIPVPFIYMFARTVLEWGKDKLRSAPSADSVWKRDREQGKS